MKSDNLKREYSPGEVLQLGWFLLRSKCIDKKIRLIRFPIILRGKRYIDFGESLTTGFWCRLEAIRNNYKSNKRIVFGKNVQINDFVHISAMERVVIGDGCLLASHVYIADNQHGKYYGDVDDSSPVELPLDREYVVNPVIIGKNCWLGEGIIVLPGVTIGDGCVIGSHSIVKHDVPAASMAVGSPAKVVKKYDFDKRCWIRI